MRIVSRVAAAFCRPDRSIIFEVRPSDILVILEAPDEIREDPLFPLMVNEGSLQIITSAAVQQELEADPVQGTGPDGRHPIPEAKPKPDPAPKSKPAKTA